jgi:hypothetical protein
MVEAVKWVDEIITGGRGEGKGLRRTWALWLTLCVHAAVGRRKGRGSVTVKLSGAAAWALQAWPDCCRCWPVLLPKHDLHPPPHTYVHTHTHTHMHMHMHTPQTHTHVHIT